MTTITNEQDPKVEDQEVSFQLNVCGTYSSGHVSLKTIQKIIEEAIDKVASCDFVEVLDADPDLEDYNVV